MNLMRILLGSTEPGFETNNAFTECWGLFRTAAGSGVAHLFRGILFFSAALIQHAATLSCGAKQVQESIPVCDYYSMIPNANFFLIFPRLLIPTRVIGNAHRKHGNLYTLQ